MKLLDAQGGYAFADHRASPGIPADAARKMGYEPEQVCEGAFFEADSYGCPHCGSVIIKNPLRKRGRHVCLQCHSFICDTCEAARHDPDYVHYTINELAEKCSSGKFAAVGPSQSKLKLVPVKEGSSDG